MTHRYCSLILVIVTGLAASGVARAQLDGRYAFDAGGDGASWDDPANWEQVQDAFGNPVNGDPPTPPDAVTSVDLPVPGVRVDGTMPGQTALDVYVGTSSGDGTLEVSGGDLTARDIVIGSGGNSGTVEASGGDLIANDDIAVGSAGSPGTLHVSSGAVATADDLLVGSDGTLMLSGGQVTAGDRLEFSGDAVLSMNGGQIFVNDDLFVLDDATLHLADGLVQVTDRITFDVDPFSTARLVVDGGLVRGNEFGDGIEPVGIVEINDGGVLQIEMLSLLDAMDLILEGEHFVSTTGALSAQTVFVDLPGRANVMFTQISVGPPHAVAAPEAFALLLAGMLAVCAFRRCPRQHS